MNIEKQNYKKARRAKNRTKKGGFLSFLRSKPKSTRTVAPERRIERSYPVSPVLRNNIRSTSLTAI